VATQPEGKHSVADTTDRINAALTAASDSCESEDARKTSLNAWSTELDLLPHVEDRIMFAEAAMTYAATLCVPTSELVVRLAQEKLAKLKALPAATAPGPQKEL
jgi:hypothetical protein